MTNTNGTSTPNGHTASSSSAQQPVTHHAPMTASNLFFTPLPPSHTVAAGKEHHGRYMLSIPWNRVSGWGQPTIGPRQEIKMDPLSGVMQYAVTCFEGMKCYKTEQGDLRLFRPEKNFDRLKRSAARLGLPCDWDNDELLDLLAKLVALETDLVPDYDGGNLYIRPNIIETSEGYGIKEDAYAGEALLYIVTTQNLGKGLYASAESAEKGIRLDACKEFIRAWPGGTGSYKLGANYGIVNVAKKKGFAMSLWLHGKEDLISEAGAMNVFMIKQASDGYLEFVTMSLDNGIVLPGITRESIIEMIVDHAAGAEDTLLKGLPREVRVVERDFSMPEVVQSIADGTIKGMFGCGTGVVLTSIREIQYENEIHQIPYCPHVLVLRDVVTALQRGKIEHEWSYRVQEWNGSNDERKEEEKQQVVAS